MLAEVLIILALVIANGVLAGAEIALVSVRATRAEQLVEEGRRGAAAVKRLRADPEHMFATIQIGITVVTTTAGVFGGQTLAADIEPLLRRIPFIAPWAEEISLAAVVTLVSYSSLVLGELVPKSLGLRYAERYALAIGRPLVTLSWIARPFVRLLTASSNVVLRLFGDRTTFAETRLSSEELQCMVDEAAKAGAVPPEAGEIASRALGFADLTVADVMVPRGRVLGVPRNATTADVRRILVQGAHSRLPVYEGTIDRVIGFLTVRDVITELAEHGDVAVGEVTRPAYFVPETMGALALLQELRRRRTHLAIVVDEHGSMSGIVTLEDLVEELVGEIFSEGDRPEADPIRREPDGSAIVSGWVPVRDANRALDLDLPEGETWSTVAGLCLELAGRIPAPGERFETPDGTRLEIVDATNRLVRTVRIVRPPPRESASEGSDRHARTP